MARPKRETFSLEEVQAVARAAIANTLGMAKSAVLAAGVEPHEKLGATIMHFANGEAHNVSEANKLSEQMSLEPERTARIQEILDGLFK